jgi:membrane protease YdiL (CAAX protease family)
VGVGFLAYLGAGLLSAALLALLAPDLASALFFPGSFVLLAVLTLVWVGARYRAVPELLGRRPRLADVGMGIAHGTLGFFAINVGFSLLLQFVAGLTGGEVPEVQQELREAAQDGTLGIFVVVSAAVFAPIAEELFFRGLLFRGIAKRLTRWPAIGISASLFGLAHQQPGNLQGTLYAFIVLATFGGYLAWVLDRRRTIVAPIAMHATFNGMALVGIFLAT